MDARLIPMDKKHPMPSRRELLKQIVGLQYERETYACVQRTPLLARESMFGVGMSLPP